MTDNKKPEVITYSGNFREFTGGVGNSGENKGAQTVNNSPKGKTCRICHQEVGIDHQNNCQCEKKEGYCGYCEENDYSRKTCTCKKSDQKPEISSNQIKDEQKESSREENNIQIDQEIFLKINKYYSELGTLITLTKEKLKSKSKIFNSVAKHKKREEKLEVFFKNLLATQKELEKGLENIKKGLSKKLTEQEINNLCQAQAELTQWRLKLEKEYNIKTLIEFVEDKINLTYQDQRGMIIHNISNNAQVGNVTIEHSQFAGTVAIGVGEITDADFSTQNAEEFQTKIQQTDLPPNPNN